MGARLALRTTFAILLLLVAGGAARSQSKVALLLRDDLPSTRQRAESEITQRGGIVVHAFDGWLVAEVRVENLGPISRNPVFAEVRTGEVPAARLRRRSDLTRFGARFWNQLLKGGNAGSAPLDGPGPFPLLEQEHAWLPPVHPAGRRPAGSGVERTPRLGARPGDPSDTEGAAFGSAPTNTSEYLAGSVSINLFLVESDGSLGLSTENWTEDRETKVVNGLANGMEWLRSLEPKANLRFVYHVIAGRVDARARTGYEPIARNADPGGTSGEDLWVKQILAHMGYPSGDRWSRSRALAHDTRTADGTDWAVNVFVVDSLQDVDGRFADGYFAYAWVGGPHVVMTYDNQLWGIDRLNMVARHEVLHAFFAFDEYASSGCSCTERRGYLDGVNGNCTACNPSSLPCVMISNTALMCPDTRRQIGWADLDGDGTVDVVGEDPETLLEASPTRVCGPLTITGSATVVAPSNRNPLSSPQASISVNRIHEVEVRVDGAAPSPAMAADGTFDGPVEGFEIRLDLLPGLHDLNVRSRDDAENVDLTPALATIDVARARDEVSASLRLEKLDGMSSKLCWDPAEGAELYRVFESRSPTGPFSVLSESTGTSISESGPAPRYFDVRSVDACGGGSMP